MQKRYICVICVHVLGEAILRIYSPEHGEHLRYPNHEKIPRIPLSICFWTGWFIGNSGSILEQIWESFTRNLAEQFQFSKSGCLFCHRSFINFNIFQICTIKFEDLWFILWTVSVHFLLCMSFSEEVDFSSLAHFYVF